MPQLGTLRLDKLLSRVSIKYRNTNFIAMEVFPEMPVKNDSDKYRIYDRNFRLPETSRADKAVSRQHDFNVSTGQYILESHSLMDVVTDRQAQNYEIASLRSDTTEELTDKILLRLEKSVADLFTTTSWSQNVSLSSSQQWSLDTTTSNPLPQMDTAGCTVVEQSGFDPSYAIIPKRVMIKAKNHSSIIERIKYTSVNITAEMLAGLFDLPKILVPKSVLDSSAEGIAASISPLWGDNVFVGYVPSSPSPLKPSAGYTFRSSMPLVKRWRDEDVAGEKIEVGMMYQAKVVASLAGYLLRDALG